MDWKNQVVLVTGGTGSFGKKFIEILVRECNPKKVIVFSRDECSRPRPPHTRHARCRYCCARSSPQASPCL